VRFGSAVQSYAHAAKPCEGYHEPNLLSLDSLRPWGRYAARQRLTGYWSARSSAGLEQHLGVHRGPPPVWLRRAALRLLRCQRQGSV